MSLIASLFVAQCLFLFGTPRTELPDVCLTLGALMHYFFLAAFLWVNVLAIDICRTFASSGHQSDASCVRFSLYSFYAWTLPALIVAGSVALDVFEVHALYRPHYGEGLCWITSRRALLVLFALPMAILLFVNILLFTVTIFHICALDRITQKALAQNNYSFQTTPPPPSLQRERNRFILCIQLSFIMGLTWVFGFLAALTDLHVLWYVFILFNTTQGAFLCIAFVCNRRVFRLLRRNKDEVAPRQTSSSLNGRSGYTRPTYLFDSDACVIAQETSI
ncbi:hypothetical protein CAPTEDRAFT_104916 [Capitella teleta]|uniref:G-protein coupled receptors family 2 profile 2 domain-containing protein n=1 Tax=Capitella teleta TaxID=283909 RepID=R7TR70_CAPTE|nr:hypothetical protein CAPTEDRAFT_104916 [Capitella teleta]|eukprot:ELT93530.1 hypothetical protein CAPTEDRAFT_104916 [Capitella teleta]